MEAQKKIYRGIGLYPKDWTRIDGLRENHEGITKFIETALTHEFELREGTRLLPRRLTSLT